MNACFYSMTDTYTASHGLTLEATAADGVLFNDTDADSDTLTAVLVSSPSHGSLTFNDDGISSGGRRHRRCHRLCWAIIESIRLLGRRRIALDRAA